MKYLFFVLIFLQVFFSGVFAEEAVSENEINDENQESTSSSVEGSENVYEKSKDLNHQNILNGSKVFSEFNEDDILKERLILDRKYRAKMLDMQIESHIKRKNNLWGLFGGELGVVVVGMTVMVLSGGKVIAGTLSGGTIMIAGTVAGVLTVYSIKKENRKINSMKKQKEIFELSLSGNGLTLNY